MDSVTAQCAKAPVVLETAKLDPRFPQTNQTKACYVWYNEMYKCYSQKGQDDEQCKKIKKDVRAICPDEWLESWEEHRANGTWWGKY
ncbi:hypothetical protein COHA_001100 [Chlorella ohadii]|uniref:Uncharacterized protein n=1 Tax=Chlorella ohadii TaxID=2649997 RepID=A0AAD5DWN1_9CHLO|nr:hypothetical protein COHA_001100 [Chlorella ohadii]